MNLSTIAHIAALSLHGLLQCGSLSLRQVLKWLGVDSPAAVVRAAQLLQAGFAAATDAYVVLLTRQLFGQRAAGWVPAKPGRAMLQTRVELHVNIHSRPPCWAALHGTSCQCGERGTQC